MTALALIDTQTDAALEDHPIAAMFPLLSDAELSALSESIKLRGLGQPIVMFEGKILDGRNRYRACLSANVRPHFVEFTGIAGDAIQSVWDWNFKRRHLNSSQAACADAERNKLVEAYAVIRERAKARQVEGGKQAGRGRPKDEQVSKLVEEPIRQDDGRTIAVRAKVAGTNPTYINVAAGERGKEGGRGKKKTLPQQIPEGLVHPRARGVLENPSATNSGRVGSSSRARARATGGSPKLPPVPADVDAGAYTALIPNVWLA